MKSQVKGYGNLGKRPRHWAAEISAGQTTLDRAPSEWRAMIQTYLDGEELELSRHVRDILKCPTRDLRRTRLNECPPAMRDTVELRVRSIFEQKAEHHG